MSSILDEKIMICYCCCGESYRRSLKDKLENTYFDDDNIYYAIIVEDKSYFKDVKRKNLIVNELKDFYEEYPLTEKNEAYLEGENEQDYAEKFINVNYRFPFAVWRFNLLQAWKLGIKNIAMMCTDAHIDFKAFNNDIFKEKNRVWNAVSEWDNYKHEEHNVSIVNDILKENFNLTASLPVRVLDLAALLYIADSLDSVKRVFDVSNTVVEKLYEKDYIKHFYGTFCRHFEIVISCVYNALGMVKDNELHVNRIFFEVKHEETKERYFRVTTIPGVISHPNYEEFLRLNNLK